MRCSLVALAPVASALMQFRAPLVADGYAAKTAGHALLVYLPGFDGANLAPFLQWPALHELKQQREALLYFDERSSKITFAIIHRVPFPIEPTTLAVAALSSPWACPRLATLSINTIYNSINKSCSKNPYRIYG